MRSVLIVWYCRTAKGWIRFPVIVGKNNRIKKGDVKIAGVETHVPRGHFQVRVYQGRKVVYKRVGDNASDAEAMRDREQHLLTAKDSAEAAGVTIIGEDVSRVYLRKAALAFEQDDR